MYPYSDQIARSRIDDLQRAAAQARMASQARRARTRRSSPTRARRRWRPTTRPAVEQP